MSHRKFLNDTVVCADGFRMSVQGHEGAYCEPRLNNQKKYNLVEIGFPSKEEPLIMPWVEDESRPTDTIYGYVPVDIVTNVIVKHGGLVSGQVPAGVIAVVPLAPEDTIQQVEEGRELTDEELENVIGGASREAFLDWAAEFYNLHRKEQYDKQINEEPARTRDD